ncbi:MAG: hypothetical protein IKE05_00300 [Clostridia bacterium]|nr:hypothetical protein [Clostridia bacterium]
MRYLELLKDLQNLTNEKLTDRRMMLAFDLRTPSAITYKKTNNSFVTDDELEKVERSFNVKLSGNRTPHLTLDYYPDVFGSCGTGEFVLSQTKQQIQVPDNVFFKKFSKVKKYSVINAYGDSMQPFIYSGDKLIVEHWNGEQIIDNQVYVFCYDNEIFVKRLTKNINQLVIKSDNTFYDVIKLTGDDLSKIIIVGQIVGLMRDLR